MYQIEKGNIKCPLCGKGMPTIEIDSYKIDQSKFSGHCTECSIWFDLSVVTK